MSFIEFRHCWNWNVGFVPCMPQSLKIEHPEMSSSLDNYNWYSDDLKEYHLLWISKRLKIIKNLDSGAQAFGNMTVSFTSTPDKPKQQNYDRVNFK